MKTFDFKNFKKVSSNDTHTTMHDGNHTIIIAHAPLSGAERKQLDSLPTVKAPHLADGGDVSDGSNPLEVDKLENEKLDYEPISKKSKAKNPVEYEELAHGGELKGNAKLQESKKTPSKFSMPEKHYADGGEETGDAPVDDSQDQIASSQAAPAATPDQQPQAGAAAPQLSDFASMGKSLGDVENQQSPNPKPAPTPEPDTMHGYGQEQQGIQGLAKAAGEQAEADTSKLLGTASALQTVKNDYNNQLQELNGERNDFIQDIQENKIDPNRLLNSRDTGQKILTGIGLFLGGLGGMGHGNQVLDFLNKQIDRDIEAQKANLGSKESLLSANLRQYGNIRDATDMTKVMMNDMAKLAVEGHAAQVGGPMAQARAQQLSGQLEAQTAPQLQRLQLNRMLLNNKDGNDPNKDVHLLRAMEVLAPDMAKELAPRIVPGVGTASVAVPDKVREQLIARDSLQKQVHDLRTWAQEHEGTVLNRATVNEGLTKAKLVQDAYRRANGQGVFREAESNFVNGIVADNPTAFLNNFRVDPKYKALEDNNLTELNSLKQGYGLPTKGLETGLSAQHKSWLDWARQNPKDPRSQAIFKKLGVQ